MIRHTNVTSRPFEDDEFTTLMFLKTLHEDWEYLGRVGDIKLFKLTTWLE